MILAQLRFDQFRFQRGIRAAYKRRYFAEQSRFGFGIGRTELVFRWHGVRYGMGLRATFRMAGRQGLCAAYRSLRPATDKLHQKGVDHHQPQHEEATDSRDLWPGKAKNKRAKDNDTNGHQQRHDFDGDS